MLVTDRHLAGGEDALVEAVSEAVAGGVTMVQLREKDLDDVAPPARSRANSATPSQADAKLVVNGSLDVAAVTAADGVHLPEDAIAARRRPVTLIAGAASIRRSRKARRGEGADYVIFGPIFETASHAGVQPAADLDAPGW